MDARLADAYWRRDDLTSIEQLIAQWLAFRAYPGLPRVKASQRFMHRCTHVNPAALTRAIAGLEAKGAIERWRAGRRSPTEYTLTPHKRA